MNPRWRLILAALAFAGWVSYLGYAAAVKSRDPIVSHAQASAAHAAVVADVAGPDEPVEVKEQGKLWGDGPGGKVEVVNLADARGYAGPGKYLLYLERRHNSWLLVGQQRSPGTDLSGVGKPLVYPWTDDVRKQEEKLRK
ncbi:unnamed protein product [Gemmataceae bacterium]|nr:unnamed protein product [Gemmataceae bacterium]VTT97527.1 unnamed protein product [Gemmataceae bacterium]